jgi:thiamine-phosphate pyrophosphorylase
MAGCLLYYITDRSTLAADEPTRRRHLLDNIAEAALAGVDYIQLRERDLSSRELESLAGEAIRVLNELRAENREIQTKVLINSRTDVALSVEADGVHLRSDDISPRDVQSIWGECAAVAPASISRKSPLIGVSCHSLEEVKRAQVNGATFAVFAPVFEKKDDPNSQPAGLTHLRKACEVRMPVLALGGITLENARQCLEVGAAGIAAIRLFQENNIRAIVGALRSTRPSS